MVKSNARFYDILNDRADASFFNDKFISLVNEIKSVPHKPLCKLADFSSENWDQKEYFEEYFPYIEIGAIDIQDGTITEINNIEKTNAPSRAKKIVRSNDIIVSTTRPSRGAISIVRGTDDITIASTGFAVIRKISDDILREYLYIMLRQSSSLLQMEQRSSGGNYPAITEDELKKILIPLPLKEIQQQIVDLYNSATEEKQAKEQEAAALLAGIDNYLLKELEIELPENTGNERYFEVSIQDLIGGRLDPMPYNVKCKTLRRMIQNSHLAKLRLKDIIIHSIAGDWGVDETEILNEECSKCLVIRSTEFDNKYNLNLDNSRVKFRYIKTDKLNKIEMKPDDLLIEKSGGSPDQPVGRIAILTEDIVKSNALCYSNFIHKIRVDNSIVIPEYAYFFLKTMYNIGVTESMQSQTNGIRNLIMGEYFRQYILLPEKNKQQQLVNNIKTLNAKAKQLQEEAKEILEKTKQIIEKRME